MSAGRALRGAGQGTLRAAVSATSVLAAVGIVLACFGSTADARPVVSVAAGLAAALALAALSVNLLRRPALAVVLVPLAIMAGAIVGIIYVGSEVQGHWVTVLGNLEVLTVRQTLLRFALSFACIWVLAVFCTSQPAARALSVFALSGPGLLLLWAARSAAVAHWVILLAAFVLLQLIWAAVIGKRQLLASAHDALGRRAVPSALKLRDPGALNAALGRIDAWIDPLGEVSGSIASLARATTERTRQGHLSGILKSLQPRSRILSAAGRARLRAMVARRPEALIVLAVDHLTRRQPDEAASRLQELTQAILPVPGNGWMAEAAGKAFRGKAEEAPALANVLQGCVAAGAVALFADAWESDEEPREDAQVMGGAVAEQLMASVQRQLAAGTLDEAGARQEALRRLLNDQAALAGATWTVDVRRRADNELKQAGKRQETLQRVIDVVEYLPESCRQTLEELAGRKPEFNIVLAESDFVRGQPVGGFVRLATLMSHRGSDLRWLDRVALDALERHRSDADTTVQQALWRRVKEPATADRSALTSLAMIALVQGLSADMVTCLERE